MKAFVRAPRANDFTVPFATNMAGIAIGTFLIVLLLSIAALVGRFVGVAGPLHAQHTIVSFRFATLERPGRRSTNTPGDG